MIKPNFNSSVLKTSISLSFDLKKRFKIVKNNTGKTLRKDDELRFRRDFEEIAKMIPNWKGTVVVIGYEGHNSKVIDVIVSESSLRRKFKEGLIKKNGEEITRYKWYKSLLLSNTYSKLKIQMVS